MAARRFSELCSTLSCSLHVLFYYGSFSLSIILSSIALLRFSTVFTAVFFFRFDLVSFLSFSNSSSVFFFFNEAVIHVYFLILLLHDRFFFSLLLMVLFFSFDATVKVATRGKKKVADNTKRKVTSEGAACSLTYRQ